VNRPHPTAGFTILELIIVIAVIGIFASISIYGIKDSREKAKASESVREVKEIERAMAIYAVNHRNQPPPDCDNLCATNPLGSNLATDLLTHAHPWGGHYSIYSTTDITGDGIRDVYIMWNDDAPQTGHNDNSGPVPVSAMDRIDAMLDDGNLSTGRVVGNGAYSTAANEMLYFVNF
jgi:prepilin-type N-terminal cleavage/methylation domain-containing protein